jgi:hypothetical protein
MSSASVVARQGSALPRVPLGFVAIAVALAIGIGVAVGANVVRTSPQQPAVAQTTTSVKHHPGTPAGKPAPMVAYRQVVSNLAAAEARHDFAAKYRFEQQLDKLLTPAVIGTIYQQRDRLRDDLQTAIEFHDTHAQAMFNNQLSKLCGAAAVRAKLDFCN